MPTRRVVRSVTKGSVTFATYSSSIPQPLSSIETLNLPEAGSKWMVTIINKRLRVCCSAICQEYAGNFIHKRLSLIFSQYAGNIFGLEPSVNVVVYRHDGGKAAAAQTAGGLNGEFSILCGFASRGYSVRFPLFPVLPARP